MPRWPYVLPSELVNYVDRRVLNQIGVDADEDIDTAVEYANTGSPHYQQALEALAAASAELDGAVMEGGRHTVAELMYLADPPAAPAAGQMPAPDHGAYVRRLVAGLWLRLRQDRRVRPGEEFEAMRRFGDWAEAELERVREGRNVIPAQPNLGAIPADLAAAREAALAKIAANSESGLPDKGTFAVAGAQLWPRRMFGRTVYHDGDRLSTGYDDGGLSGPCR